MLSHSATRNRLMSVYVVVNYKVWCFYTVERKVKCCYVPTVNLYSDTGHIMSQYLQFPREMMRCTGKQKWGMGLPSAPLLSVHNMTCSFICYSQ